MLVQRASQSHGSKTGLTCASCYTDACVYPNVWTLFVIVNNFKGFFILSMCESALVATHRVKNKQYLSVE